MAAKISMVLSIIGIFVIIFLLFFFAWGSSFIVGAIGMSSFILLYIIIIITPLSNIVIKTAHNCEPRGNKMFNAFLVAVSFYYTAVKVAARIAGLFLLICRLIISFAIYIATHRLNIAYISFYISKLPLKIYMVLSSPFEALIEWIITQINMRY